MPATTRYYDALNTAARLPARVLRNFSFAVAVAGTAATIANKWFGKDVTK